MTKEEKGWFGMKEWTGKIALWEACVKGVTLELGLEGMNAKT